MSMPKLLTSDYTIVAKWSDNNTAQENRAGYFVTKDCSSSGNIIKKATSSSDVLGVTVAGTGFEDTECAHVGIIGIVSVIDNGTCTDLTQKCIPTTDGTAVPSTSTGYQIVDRVDSTHISILINATTSSNTASSVSGKTLILR